MLEAHSKPNQTSKEKKEGGHFSALLTDLLKVFNCLPHDLFIAKLDAYGFKNDALYVIFNYWNNRKQKENKVIL